MVLFWKIFQKRELYGHYNRNLTVRTEEYFRKKEKKVEILEECSKSRKFLVQG